MIKLKQLLIENNRRDILKPRKTGEERKLRRILVVGKQIRNNVVNGVYEGDLLFDDSEYSEYLKNLELESFEKLGIQNLIIDGDFSCYHIDLKSLRGSPKKVTGDFYCDGNYIKTLEGAPREIGGNFICDDNKLTSLQGAPEKVGGDFYCRSGVLTSIEGAPREIHGSFDCNSNYLTTLKGGPEYVGGSFDCSGNNLTSLQGAPKIVGGDFYCQGNIKHFTKEEIRAVCDVKGNVIV